MKNPTSLLGALARNPDPSSRLQPMKRLLLALAVLPAVLLAIYFVTRAAPGTPADLGESDAGATSPRIDEVSIRPAADASEASREVLQAAEEPGHEVTPGVDREKLKVDLLAAHSFYFDGFLEPMSPAARSRWYGAAPSRLEGLPDETRRRLLAAGPIRNSASSAPTALYQHWMSLAEKLPVHERADLLGLDFVVFDEHDRDQRDIWDHTTLLWLLHMETEWSRIQDKVIQYVLTWSPDGGHRGNPNDLLLVLLEGVGKNPASSHQVLELLELQSPPGSGRYVFEDVFCMTFVAALAGEFSYVELQRHYDWLRSPERRGGILWGYVELVRYVYVDPGDHAVDFEIGLVPHHLAESEDDYVWTYTLELLAKIGAPALPLMEDLLTDWLERFDRGETELEAGLRKLLPFASIAGLDPEQIWGYRSHPVLRDVVIHALSWQLDDEWVAQRVRELASDPNADPVTRAKAATFYASERSDVDALPEEAQQLALDNLVPLEGTEWTIGGLQSLAQSSSPSISNQAFLGLLGDVDSDQSFSTVQEMAMSPHVVNQEQGLSALGQLVLHAQGTEYEETWSEQFRDVLETLLGQPAPPELLASFSGHPDPAEAFLEHLAASAATSGDQEQ